MKKNFSSFAEISASNALRNQALGFLREALTEADLGISQLNSLYAKQPPQPDQANLSVEPGKLDTPVDGNEFDTLTTPSEQELEIKKGENPDEFIVATKKPLKFTFIQKPEPTPQATYTIESVYEMLEDEEVLAPMSSDPEKGALRKAVDDATNGDYSPVGDQLPDMDVIISPDSELATASADTNPSMLPAVVINPTIILQEPPKGPVAPTMPEKILPIEDDPYGFSVAGIDGSLASKLL